MTPILSWAMNSAFTATPGEKTSSVSATIGNKVLRVVRTLPMSCPNRSHHVFGEDPWSKHRSDGTVVVFSSSCNRMISGAHSAWLLLASRTGCASARIQSALLLIFSPLDAIKSSAMRRAHGWWQTEDVGTDTAHSGDKKGQRGKVKRRQTKEH